VIFHWNRLGLPVRTQSILASAARAAILEPPISRPAPMQWTDQVVRGKDPLLRCMASNATASVDSKSSKAVAQSDGVERPWPYTYPRETLVEGRKTRGIFSPGFRLSSFKSRPSAQAFQDLR
jgi:hypothetical protein